MTVMAPAIRATRHAPAQAKAMSASDGVKPPRAFQCAGCGAVVHLYEHQMLPKGWLTIELYVHRTAGQYRAAVYTYKCAACAAAKPRRMPNRRPAKTGMNGDKS